MSSQQNKTFLPVVLAADNFPSSPYSDPYPTLNPTTNERLIPFHLTFSDYQAHLPPLGHLRPEVISELQEDEREPTTCPWQFHSTARGEEDADLTLQVECVFLADWVVQGGSEVIGRVMQDTAEKWRAEGKFSGQLDGESPKSGGIIADE